MCETCGCGDPEIVPVEVRESLLAGNDHQAGHNRRHFEQAGVLAINLMGSPGAGKTAVLEATARRTRGRLRLAALSGDLATDNDARRLESSGIPAISITTGSACHLDADGVHRGFHHLEHRLEKHPGGDSATAPDVLFIENVGNLVCPAIFDLGQAANVIALSITEGEDKPLKYPVMFKDADLVLLTKIDLLPYLPGVRVETIHENLARVMPRPEAIEISALDGVGIEDWLAWLARKMEPRPQAAPLEAPAGRKAREVAGGVGG